MLVQREVGAAADDPVDVAAPCGVKAGVEFGRGVLGFKDGDGVRAEMGVERVAHLSGGERLQEIDVRDLPESVDAGVGAPRAGDDGGLAVERERGFFQRLLHGAGVVLPLPAGVPCAVVFDGELVA